MASIEDFAKLELKIALVLNVEKVEGADKLLKLLVKIGEEQRTIVAGIAKSYAPEELINKKIVVITNLEPRKLKGIESQGMILATPTIDGWAVLVPDKETEDGSKVS